MIIMCMFPQRIWAMSHIKCPTGSMNMLDEESREKFKEVKGGLVESFQHMFKSANDPIPATPTPTVTE